VWVHIVVLIGAISGRQPQLSKIAEAWLASLMLKAGSGAAQISTLAWKSTVFAREQDAVLRVFQANQDLRYERQCSAFAL